MANNIQEMLKFFEELKKEKREEDSAKALSSMDSFKIDSRLDFDLGEIYFVTREKKYEDRDDSYMYYEMYDKDGTLLARTNENFELEIVDEKKLEEYKAEIEKYNDSHEDKIDSEQKKVMYSIEQELENGNKELAYVVMDEVDFSEENDLKLLKNIEKSRKSTVANKGDIPEKGKTEQEKTEKEKQEKTEDEIKKENDAKAQSGEGKKINKMEQIIDPLFYQLVPDATIRSYFVEYTDGTYGVINGRGDDITTDNPVVGSLMVEKVDRSTVENDNTVGINTDYTIKIRGTTSDTGICFPIVNKYGKSILEYYNIYEKNGTEFAGMGNEENGKDTKEEIAKNEIKDIIYEYLMKNGMEKEDLENDDNKEIINDMIDEFYKNGNMEPSEIDVEKAYKRIKEQRDEKNPNDQGDRGGRKPPSANH